MLAKKPHSGSDARNWVWRGNKNRPASVHAQSLDMSSVAQSLDGEPSGGEPAFSPVAANTAVGIGPVNQELGSARRTTFNSI
jgi:hypothetical protein